MFELFPPEHPQLMRLTEGDFTDRLSKYLVIPVHHADRELFRIESTDPAIIARLKAYFTPDAAE